MLAEARARNDQAWLCVGDADALPLLRGSLGMVFLSNVIHHLADLQRAAEGFAHALEPRGFVVVRNYLREQLRQLPYLEFFPEAMTLSMDNLDSKTDIERAFGRAGFQLVSFQSVEQPVADSPLQYLKKIRARVYSDLAAISDEAFGAGVARMATAVSTGWRRSLAEPVGLFSFQRRAAA
jgi:SAM-dependent methyltransferase